MTRTEFLYLLSFIERTRDGAVDCLGVTVVDPYWRMTLYLLRRHLSNRLVTVSSLADSSGVPHATAMRRIDDMFAAGLLCRKPRSESGKSFAIEPTPELLGRVRAYALGVKGRVGETLGLGEEERETYYFGGAYMAARIIPPPAPLVSLGEKVSRLRLLLKRQPSFNALVRLRARLEQLAGCRLELTILEYEELLERILENNHQEESEFDIIGVAFGWLGELVSADALLPLDDLLSPDPPGIFDFYPAAWEAAQYEGTQYGIPIEPITELLCYRTDIFEAAGLEPPRTTEQVLQAGRQLQDPSRDFYGLAWNAARGQPLGQTFIQVLGAFGRPPLKLRRFGDNIDLSELRGEALRPSFDTAAARGAADYLVALLEISPPGILEMDWDGRLDAYAKGQVAMSYNWSSRVAEFEVDATSPAKGRSGYLPHPSGPGCPTVAPVGGYALGIPANLAPDRIAAAWQAIMWLTSPEMAKLVALNGASVSPRFSVSADPEVLALTPVIGVVDGLAQTTQLQRWPHPPVPEFMRMVRILGTEMHLMLTGDSEPKAALARAQARVDAMMREAGHY